MPLGNDYLTRARSEKNDEFYTRYEDIESEVSKFRERFDGKVVYCPTDGSKSNFTRYFNDHFNDLNLKALYCSDIHEGIVWFRDTVLGWDKWSDEHENSFSQVIYFTETQRGKLDNKYFINFN